MVKMPPLAALALKTRFHGQKTVKSVLNLSLPEKPSALAGVKSHNKMSL
jgi:hypothetical protein